MSYKTYEVIVHDNGTEEWRLNGKLHRENGPALVYSNGDKKWWINDKLHRTDGPALEFGSLKEWWIEGVHYSEAEFHAIVNPHPLAGKVVEVEGKEYTLTPTTRAKV